MTTFAGSGSSGSSDGQGTAATFNKPYGMAFDAESNLYVAEYGSDIIRKIDPAGNVTTFTGLAIILGQLMVNSQMHDFMVQLGLTFDPEGNLYVTEYKNHTVRKIDTNGNVTTVAGTTGIAGSTGGIGATKFNIPYGIAGDESGNVFVGDFINNTIRKIHLVGDTVRFNIQVADIAGNSSTVTSTTDGSVVEMDTDGDGFTDAVEIAAGSSATDANSMPVPDFTETVGAVINADDSDATGLATAESNLALWLDASNINGQSNTGFSNGDAISTWMDLSGNGNNASAVDVPTPLDKAHHYLIMKMSLHLMRIIHSANTVNPKNLFRIVYKRTQAYWKMSSLYAKQNRFITTHAFLLGILPRGISILVGIPMVLGIAFGRMIVTLHTLIF